MNNKVKILVASLAVGMAATMAGCGGCVGCAGCNKNTASHTLTRSNWFTGTSYNGIQPSFIEGHKDFSKEEVTYKVYFDDTTATNTYYSVDYKDGKYTTEFYATQFDWTRADMPEGYAKDSVKKETVYYYKSTLTISVQFTLKTGNKAQSEWFNDSVVTESYFRAAGKNLQPVYSKQKIVSTSPANYQPTTLKDAYREIDVEYENFYNYNCTKVLSTTTDYKKDDPTLDRIGDGVVESKEYDKLNKLKRSFFDNSSLYVAIRSMKLSSNLSESISLFSGAAGGIDTYLVSGSGAALTAQERADFTSALSDKGLYSPSSPEDEGVQATAVTVSYTGGNMHGTSQTVWYASILDNDNNVSRATMLKLSVPISFSLGTLNYTLEEVKSTLWNG